jgi:hypothetical protein
MLTSNEEKFLTYWAANRENKKQNFKQFIKGFSSGIAIGICILVIIGIGWYSRANMEANAKASPVLIIICIGIVAVFMAFMYKNYKWEQNEQLYQELMAKKKKQNKPGSA